MRTIAVLALIALVAQSIFFWTNASAPAIPIQEGLPDFSKLKWEVIERQTTSMGEEDSNVGYMRSIERCQVPGGWLVRSTLSDHFAIKEFGVGQGSGSGLTFIPDPQYKWKLE